LALNKKEEGSKTTKIEVIKQIRANKERTKCSQEGFSESFAINLSEEMSPITTKSSTPI
jgi:hypothetical protein